MPRKVLLFFPFSALTQEAALEEMSNTLSPCAFAIFPKVGTSDDKIFF